MWKAGQLPLPAEQLPTGTIIVKEIKTPAHAVGVGSHTLTVECLTGVQLLSFFRSLQCTSTI